MKRPLMSSFWTMLILIYPVTEVNAQIQIKEYGETCSVTQPCNPSARLKCASGICSCLAPEDMIYEPDLGKCVSKVGGPCYRFRDHDDQCVKYSRCTGLGYCECMSGYFQEDNDTCSAHKMHGMSCSSDTECHFTSGLVCPHGICQCVPDKLVFSVDDGHCVGLAGAPCVKGRCTVGARCYLGDLCACDDEHYPTSLGTCENKRGHKETCTNDSECSTVQALSCVNGVCGCNETKARYEEYYNHFPPYQYAGPQCVGLPDEACIQGKCVTNAGCYQRTCKCAERQGYVKSKDLSCKKGHGRPCDKDDPCAVGLVCDTGFCQCPDTRHQMYNKTEALCLSIVDGPCTLDGDCVPNAGCRTTNTGSRCVCNPGFTQNEIGQCDLEHGADCNKTLVSCDTVAGLRCRNGFCHCPQEAMTFDPVGRQCRWKVGSKCVVADKWPCVENATCKLHPNPKLRGNCVCKEGYDVTLNGTCYGQSPPVTTTTTMKTPTPEPGQPLTSPTSTTADIIATMTSVPLDIPSTTEIFILIPANEPEPILPVDTSNGDDLPKEVMPKSDPELENEEDQSNGDASSETETQNESENDPSMVKVSIVTYDSNTRDEMEESNMGNESESDMFDVDIDFKNDLPS